MSERERLSVNKHLVTGMYDEVFCAGNLSIIDQVIAEDFVDRTAPPDYPQGRDGLRRTAQMFAEAFDRWTMTYDGVLAEGDDVVFWGTGRGRQTGPFFGAPAKDIVIEMPGMHQFRVHDGSIIEHRGFNDKLSVMKQLGMV